MHKNNSGEIVEHHCLKKHFIWTEQKSRTLNARIN